MGISAVSLMHVHCYGVQLFETSHGPHQEDDQASSFYGLNGPAKQVRRKRLKILQDKHLVSITQNLVGFLVVGIPDLIGADEQLKGVIDILIIEPLHLHILDLLHPLLLVAAELQLVLVAPEYLGLAAIAGQLAEDVVEIEHLVARAVAHQHQHRALVRFVSVLDQGLDAAVDLLLHC